MKQYKGYYIDNIIFHSKEEIDEHIKQQMVERFMTLNKLFATIDCYTEASVMCNEVAERLHSEYGISYEELEQMEIEAYKTA